MPFTFTKLAIPELIMIEAPSYGDDRGYFREFFKETEFKANGINEKFLQSYVSRSKQGVVRGLHYQLPPSAQGKLVGVLSGKVFDAVVDIRKDSPTFKQWVGVELSEDNNRMLYIPPGFAHGFMALSPEVKFFYQCTAEYDKAAERGIIWNDQEIGIDWPTNNALVISEKDKSLPPLGDAEIF